MNEYVKAGISQALGTNSNQLATATQRRLAQSFTAHANCKVMSIGMYVASVVGTAINTNTYLELWSGDTPGAGTLLGTSEPVVMTTALNGTIPRWRFTVPVDIAIGSTYHFIAISDMPVGGNNWTVFYSNSANPYAGGSQWLFDGTTWTNNATYDFRFFIYTNEDGGVYNVDTPNTTITALETLKGSAITKAENIYFYGGVADVVLILDKSFACNQIFRGITSSGAAPAGIRGGIMVINNGITVQFQGNATNTSSGFNSNPATPDASSLGEAIRHDGDYSTVFTRDGDAYLSTSRFTLEVRYGWLNVKKLVVRNTHLAAVSNLGTNATRTNNNHLFDECDISIASQGVINLHTTSISVKILATRTKLTVQGAGSSNIGIIAGVVQNVLEAGGEIDVSNSYVTNTIANGFSPISYSSCQSYIGCCKLFFADNRQPYSIPFYLDKTVVPVTAGTLITVTLSQDLATLMTGLTLKGVACTDRTVTGANTLTFVAPDLETGIGDVVGSFTGYADFTISNGITAQEASSLPAPESFLAVATAWGAQSIKVEWGSSAFGEYYTIERDSVVVSPSSGVRNLSYFIDTPVSTGIYEYVVKAHNDSGITSSNTITITKGEGGLGTIYGVLMAIYRMLFNTQKIEKVGSTYYLNTYDDDGVGLVASCALKTYDGNDIADRVATVTASNRLRSLISGSGSEMPNTLIELASKIFKKHFNTRKNEIVDAGVISETVYDNDDETMISNQHLKTYDGNNLPSQVNTTSPQIRNKSNV